MATKDQEKIGLVFTNDPGWTGGTDYIINLINALALLPEAEQPPLVLLIHNEEDKQLLLSRTAYPKLEFHLIRFQPIKSILDKTLLKLRLKQPSAYPSRLKFIYPMPVVSSYASYFRKTPVQNRIFWIPDFQEKYFPELFEKEALAQREQRRSFLISRPEHTIILSSHAAKADLLKFYPENKARLKVLHFAVPQAPATDQDVEAVRKKYELPEHYFLCPNQFWKHKNHLTVLQAVKAIQNRGKKVCVAFCGKEHDPRNPDHVPALKAYVQQHELEKSARFLGFLPKEDQVALIQGAQAILQPSLFEGWSTTIEDAISMGKPVIASDLPVNREQLGEKGHFFSPLDEPQLTACLLQKEWPGTVAYHHRKKVLAFADGFLHLPD